MSTELKTTSRKQPSQKDLEKIVGCLERGNHPSYLGFLAVAVGCNLAHAHVLIETLIDRGIVRSVNDKERDQYDIRPESYVYTLVKSRTYSDDRYQR